MQKTLFAFLFIFALSVNALAENQNLTEIYPLVAKQLKQDLDQKYKEVEINVRNLPDNLQLAKCETEIEIETNQTNSFQARQSVLVNCRQPSWRIFINAEIKAKINLVVSSHAIQRSAVINKNDVELKLVSAQHARANAIESLESVIGMRTRRMIKAQTPITPQMLATAYWVYKGQEVTLVSEANGVEISATGIALENGQQQDRITVKNKSSNIELKGTVIAPGIIKVF